MAEEADIEKWIMDELNRGCDTETIKKQLKQNGYDPGLIDGLVDQVTKENTALNPPDNSQASPQMQYTNTQPQNGAQNNSVAPNTNSPQSNLNENPGAQNSTNSPLGNSPASPAQTTQFQNMGFIEKAKMILFNPKGFFNIMPQSGGYKDPIVFYTIIIVILTLLASLYKLILGRFSDGFVSLVMNIVTGPILLSIILIPLLFLFALLFHASFKTLGSKANYESTVRVMAYSSLPIIFLWIPFIGILISFYTQYIAIVGYKKVHNMSTLRVLFAILLIIGLLLIIPFLLVFSSWMGGL